MATVVLVIHVVLVISYVSMPFDVFMFPFVQVPPVVSVITVMQMFTFMPDPAVVSVIAGVLVNPAMLVVTNVFVFFYMIVRDVVVFVPPDVTMVL